MLRLSMLVVIAGSVALSVGPLFSQEAELDGSNAVLETAPTPGGAGGSWPIWLDPEGKPLPFADAEEVLQFLAEAEVLHSRPIPTGVTKPRKLLLERDGVRAHAVFHDVDIQRARVRLRSGEVVYFFRDHYANNVAAFELGRLLGISNVPPAVVRRVGRKKGSVQLWIENANTEADRRQREIVPPTEWRLAARDMRIFDNLASNPDRNQGNILYDANWRLWYIDHTRAFGRSRELPTPEFVKRCSRRLWQALRGLEAAEVRRVLRPYLGNHEIAAILHRHERLLALIAAQIAERGEDVVLFSYRDAAPPGAGHSEGVKIPAPPPP